MSADSVDVKIDLGPALATVDEMQTIFKKGSREGVVAMSREIAGAAASATRVSRATRTIVKRKPGVPVEDMVFYAKKPTRRGLKYIGIVAPSKSHARNDKKAIIKRRGLAKLAWAWMLSDMGYSSTGAARYTGPRKSRRYYNVDDMRRAKDPSIRLHSRLRYAQDAFKTKGRATIDNIGTRANNRFVRKMEKRAVKAGINAKSLVIR